MIIDILVIKETMPIVSSQRLEVIRIVIVYTLKQHQTFMNDKLLLIKNINATGTRND